MAFCSNCGAQLKEGSSFCGSCGARVNAASAADASYSAASPSGTSYGGNGSQSSSAAAKPKISGKMIGFIAGGAALLVVAILLIVLLGGKSELTLNEFADKYVEAYKAYGDYDYYVSKDDESFRNSILYDVEILSGKPRESNYFGASQCLYVKIKRKVEPTLKVYFVVYPDEDTAENAFPMVRSSLEASNRDPSNIVYKSEGSNSESLTVMPNYYGNCGRVVRVGKTLLTISGGDDLDLVKDVFDIFGY